MGPARPLSEADRQAGVVEDFPVRLGSDPQGPEGRLVRVEAEGHTFLLFTNLADLEAELVAMPLTEIQPHLLTRIQPLANAVTVN